ncbi:hypothetical protein [Streptomyces gobiensis]|uniref:hypothetical protein n=1 Tax=Streptomyces gobiensis TaxID=2875706 RepID=UPI001E2BEF14|nr:hypothetical protein [Streptomyces gobiensis]UGY94558.1 hypothetical protein test1122_24390 [Streptomyces gobiensis]
METVLDLTGGIGVDRVNEAVGADAERPGRGAWPLEPAPEPRAAADHTAECP